MSGLGALADPTRRRIVELLGTGDFAAGEIVERFAKRARISQHLKVLRRPGWCGCGSTAAADLQPRSGGLDEIERWVASVRRFWSERLDALAREPEAAADGEERSER